MSDHRERLVDDGNKQRSVGRLAGRRHRRLSHNTLRYEGTLLFSRPFPHLISRLDVAKTRIMLADVGRSLSLLDDDDGDFVLAVRWRRAISSVAAAEEHLVGRRLERVTTVDRRRRR